MSKTKTEEPTIVSDPGEGSGTYIALQPQLVNGELIGEGEDMTEEVNTWPWTSRDQYILAGAIRYVPADDEVYFGPEPLQPYVTERAQAPVEPVLGGVVIEETPEGKPMVTDNANANASLAERQGVESSPDPADVPKGTIADVMEWVGEDSGRAEMAWLVESERPQGPRKGLLGLLEGLIAEDDDSGSEGN